MNSKIFASSIILCLLFKITQPIAVSVVYNYRIAQITQQPLSERLETEYPPSMFLTLLFEHWQTKYSGDIDQNFTGTMFSYKYKWDHYFFRTDFAWAHINESIHDIKTFSDNEPGDILFSLGRNWKIDNEATITATYYLGFPTHPVYELKHTSFGFGQIGTGIQLDGAFKLKKEYSLLAGARYLYFIPRGAQDDAGNHYKFTVGNLFDILVAIKRQWEHEGYEFGYTARVDFGAQVNPFFNNEIIQKQDYERNNFYFVYKYNFQVHELHNRLLFDVTYGWENQNPYHNKNILMFWASWDINF